jgi:hypothetical protein
VTVTKVAAVIIPLLRERQEAVELSIARLVRTNVLIRQVLDSLEPKTIGKQACAF